MRRCMLTTFDNSYDSFKQFTSCFLFDVKKGYDSSAYLGGSTTTASNYMELIKSFIDLNGKE